MLARFNKIVDTIGASLMAHLDGSILIESNVTISIDRFFLKKFNGVVYIGKMINVWIFSGMRAILIYSLPFAALRASDGIC